VSVDVAAWRARLAPLGVWCTLDRLPAPDAAAVAQEAEAHGYSALWLPETTARDPFASIAFLGARTERLVLATGIANIHHRHPGPMVQATATLSEQTGDRFVLAMGVSHAPLVEGIRGLDYGKPLATMRRYLEAMDASPYHGAPPPAPAPRLLGALGPKMLELAAERGDGAHPYWTTPEHTAQARAILGPDKLLCVEQKVVLSTDREVVRRTAEKALGTYRSLPNYRNTWLRLGFTDDEIDGLADRFLDSVVASGDVDAVTEHVRQHLDAGADHVCIQPMTPDRPLTVDAEALAALAPVAHPIER